MHRKVLEVYVFSIDQILNRITKSPNMDCYKMKYKEYIKSNQIKIIWNTNLMNE